MKQMIAFGDSNTWGLNPVLNSRYPENVRWTGLLRKKLSREGILLVEEGLCGRTTVFNDPIRKGLKGADDQVIVISGTTAEDYLIKNNPEIKLQKYDTYANAKTALENGNAVAWANDNTEVIAFALENEGYEVGIPSLGSQDTIAPAVSKGNETLLTWINDEIVALAAENFFHADYEATLVDTYGLDYEDSLVLEGGGQAK